MTYDNQIDSGELKDPKWHKYVYVGEFNGSEVLICSHFGCGCKLSLPESLAGSRCTKHMNIKPINITSTIKRP